MEPRESLPPALWLAVEAAAEHKGQDLVVLDLRELASFTDYMLICSGRSERQVQAISEAIGERLLGERVEPLHTEGTDGSTWILIDYVDFLVHVFTPETREFYQLERLWRDAPLLMGSRSGVGGEPSGEEGAGGGEAGAGTSP